ncbi:hypothetical protein EJ06DRAFT_38662 [Trichodelitschia bisporula]|uniref:Uncharacterized protein n=1 Tax=Trichodelitschia bisporula TaxID=703511 RepID=A0A6G1HV12_9PEZI|nr:hypothetical protein EJ06DRAFT_38662 [Trichodelitschia bisporula]
MKVSPVIKAQYLPKAKRAFTTMKQVKATATAASPAPTSSVDRQLQVRSSEEHMRDLQVQEQPAVDSQMQDQLTIDAPAQEQPFIDSPASVWHEFFILFALGTGIGTGMALVYVTFKVLEASWEWSDLENSISRLWAEWDEVRYEEVDHLVPYVGAFQHPRHITDAWWGRDIGYVGHVRQRGSMGSKGEWEV